MWTNFPLTAAVVDAAAEHGEGVFKMSSPEFNILYKKATKLYKAEGGTSELSKNGLLTRRQIGGLHPNPTPRSFHDPGVLEDLFDPVVTVMTSRKSIARIEISQLEVPQEACRCSLPHFGNLVTISPSVLHLCYKRRQVNL